MRDFVAGHQTNGVAFPNTEAVDATSPSALDGTEFIKIGIDDGLDWGYAQAVLDAAGLTPNGVKESVGNSQKLDAQQILFGIPRAYISGLVPSSGADVDHDIIFGVGEARSALSASRERILLASAITKQLDVDWAAGNNAGGFPSGLTLAIDTWYHLFAIKNNATKVVDAGFDTSLVAANLLADTTGYTEFKRIGSVLTDGSSNILPFSALEQSGGGLLVDYKAQVDDLVAFNAATARQTLVLSVPLGVPVIAKLWCGFAQGSGSVFAWIRDVNYTDAVAASGQRDLFVSIGSEQAQIQAFIQTDNSQTIAHRQSATTSSLSISTLGYIDGRIS